MSSTEQPWYDRFFSHEYLAFDKHPESHLEIEFIEQALHLTSDTLVLDLCCGYGRHTHPLASKCRIFSLARSQIMLAKAAETMSSARLVRADIRAIPFFSSCFDAIISMFSSLGYFDSEDENYRVLKGIADSLRPGGRVLLETVNREFVVRHSSPQQVYRTGNMTLIEERTFDPLSSRTHVDVTVFEEGRQTHLHHSIRIYAFTELEILLESVGLRTVNVWGDFRGGDYTVDSAHMIVLSERV